MSAIEIADKIVREIEKNYIPTAQGTIYYQPVVGKGQEFTFEVMEIIRRKLNSELGNNSISIQGWYDEGIYILAYTSMGVEV